MGISILIAIIVIVAIAVCALVVAAIQAGTTNDSGRQ